LYAYTAGNPNFVGKIAYQAVDRLNAEGRNVVTSQDIAAIAMMLSHDSGNFSSTVLSPQLLTEDEISAAKQLAAATPTREQSIDKEAAYNLVGEDMLLRLKNKSLFRLRDGRIEARGLLLLNYLQKLTEFVPQKIELSDGRRRVGLFIDLENILKFAPEANLTEFGKRLIRYANDQGHVQTKQAVADQRNLPNATPSKMQLEAAGFEVTWVPKEYSQKKNMADQFLLERLDDEIDHWDLEMVVVGLGDQDYGPRIKRLLEKGIAVKLLGAQFSPHIAGAYYTLEEERRTYCLSEGRDD